MLAITDWPDDGNISLPDDVTGQFVCTDINNLCFIEMEEEMNEAAIRLVYANAMICVLNNFFRNCDW